VDNIVIHENGHFPSLQDLSSWHASFDKANFSFVVHSQPQFNASQIVSASKHVSYLYVTDDELDPPADDHDPWGTISSHIELLAESLDSPSVAIQIDSRNLVGDPIQSNNLVISSGGLVVRTGSSPLFYNATSAITYAVSVVDFGNFTFSHWENFDTSQTRTVTPLQNTTLIAFYNTVPTAVNDSGTTAEDTPVTISVLVNDSDPDGNTLSVTSTSTPSNGTTSINANNTITYSPNPGFSGTDSFNYTISDGNGGTDTATVTVTIFAAPPPPPSTATLTVQSTDMGGTTFEGMWTELWQNGQLIKTGFTPFRVQLDSNAQYVVDVANYQNIIFDHWENGSTTRARTVKIGRAHV